MRQNARKHKHWLIRLVAGLVLLATLSLAQLLSASADGVLFVSPAGSDANDCLTMASACRTIPAAIVKASSSDTIIIGMGTYTESIGIGKDLTLIGFGADATIINQGTIIVTNASVRIYDLAIMDGNSDAGRGLFNDRGNVTLGYESVLSNHASIGGGIYNQRGTVLLEHSIIADNSVSQGGGGILNSEFATMTIDTSAIISNSTVSGSGFSGAGILNFGTLVITNGTISANTGAGLDNGSVATLTNATLAMNVFRGIGNAGIVALKNTIIANTSSGSNCYGRVITSLGHNLSGDSSCTLHASGDVTNTNPLLGPLQDNGGPTPTHALLPGSPAVNHGDNAGCPATDQRGIARPQGGVCDIGAYEVVFTETLFLPVVPR